MNQDEIIAMAKEAGYVVPAWRDHVEIMERFALLVAARERKLCIRDCHEFANHLRGFRDMQGAAIVDACAAVMDARGTKEGA